MLRHYSRNHRALPTTRQPEPTLKNLRHILPGNPADLRGLPAAPAKMLPENHCFFAIGAHNTARKDEGNSLARRLTPARCGQCRRHGFLVWAATFVGQ
jgi:hypothetical protein